MTLADEWYDDWLLRLVNRARSPFARKRLELERAQINHTAAEARAKASAWDDETERLRRSIHAAA